MMRDGLIFELHEVARILKMQGEMSMLYAAGRLMDEAAEALEFYSRGGT